MQRGNNFNSTTHTKSTIKQHSQTHMLYGTDSVSASKTVNLEANAVVPCQNKIILKNFRPEPPPSSTVLKSFYFSTEPRLKLF